MKKIAIAIDYCPVSSEALKEAVRLASRDGATVTAIHVFDERFADDLKDHGLPFDQDAILEGAGRRLHDFIVEAVPESDVKIAENVTIGHPFDALYEFVDRESPDCLVLGLHGKMKPHQQVGELAAKCVRKLPLPVMLVSDGCSGAAKHVVACIDFSQVSSEVARGAIAAARRDNAQLHFVHIFRPLGLTLGMMDQYMPNYALLPEEEIIMAKKRHLHEFVQGFDGETEGLTVDNSVICDLDVAGAIRKFARGKSGCLVVLGTLGRTGLRGIFMGTTAEKIVRNTLCDILAIKPKAFKAPKIRHTPE